MKTAEPNENGSVSPGEKPTHGGARPGAGRPLGSTNKVGSELRQLAQGYGPDAIAAVARLAGLECDAEGKLIGVAQSEQTRLAALSLLLDRGFGRPSQAITGGDADSEPLTIKLADSTDAARRIAMALTRAVAQQSANRNDGD